MTTLDDQLHHATPNSFPTLDHAALQHRGRRRRRVTQLATSAAAVMAVGSVVGLGTMVAGPPQSPTPMAAVLDVDTNEHPACESVDGVYSSPDACAESIRDDVLAEVGADGSAFERSVLADAEVTPAEYEEAAHRATACMNQILGKARPGATVEAVQHETSLGPQYGFEYVVPDDGQRVIANEVDRAAQQVEAASCLQEHFDSVHQIWTAEMIAAQGR